MKTRFMRITGGSKKPFGRTGCPYCGRLSHCPRQGMPSTRLCQLPAGRSSVEPPSTSDAMIWISICSLSLTGQQWRVDKQANPDRIGAVAANVPAGGRGRAGPGPRASAAGASDRTGRDGQNRRGGSQSGPARRDQVHASRALPTGFGQPPRG